MIELAPNHKIGLSVANPILLAGGSIGYGEAIHPALNTAKLGAVTVGPLLMHSRAGSPAPRLQEVEGGFVLDTGLQNRGLQATLRNFSKSWQRLGCPVLVQVAESNTRRLAEIVQRLESVDGVGGIELLLPDEADSRLVRNLLRSITESCDLPVLVKLPLERAVELAGICVENEAAGLVLGGARSLLGSKTVERGTVDNQSVERGNLFGPIVFPRMLSALKDVAQLKLNCSLIACGGIYRAEQVCQALAAGAQAVQIDSAIWTEPGLPEQLVEYIASIRTVLT